MTVDHSTVAVAHNPPLKQPDEIVEIARLLSKEKVIAFDTEFIRESTFFPRLEILQVATLTHTWLIDVPAFRRGQGRGEPAALKPLFDVLKDPNILKVVHAAQADQECLFTSFGMIASPTLDTEVAASLCGYGDGCGLGALLKNVIGIQIKKGHARTDWSARPLPPQQLEYAHADVKHLVELGQTLLEQLEKKGRRDWALRLSAKWEDPALHEPPPELLAERLSKGGKIDKKSYPVLLELVRWRERRVRELNVPRRWLADDSTLVDIAQVRPKDVGHLASFRGLNRGEIKNGGTVLIDIIAKAAHLEVQRPAHGPRTEPATAEEGRALDLLKCYVGILADQHDLAVKHILLSDQMLRLLRSNPKSVADLEEAGILPLEATRILGEEIVAMLQGRRGLQIDKDRVKIVNVSSSSKPADDKSSG